MRGKFLKGEIGKIFNRLCFVDTNAVQFGKVFF